MNESNLDTPKDTEELIKLMERGYTYLNEQL